MRYAIGGRQFTAIAGPFVVIEDHLLVEVGKFGGHDGGQWLPDGASWQLRRSCGSNRGVILRIFDSGEPVHSDRNATMGSMFAASRAGRRQAKAATPTKSSAARTNAIASLAGTPNTRLAIQRVAPRETATPPDTPCERVRAIRGESSAATWDGNAPSAIRTPISPVRGSLSYEPASMLTPHICPCGAVAWARCRTWAGDALTRNAGYNLPKQEAGRF